MIVYFSVNDEHFNNTIDNHASRSSTLPPSSIPYFTSLDTMAGAMFIDALGLIGTGLGIVQFGMDHFVQNQKDPQGTVVAIKAGDGAGASNTLVSRRGAHVSFATLTHSNRVVRSPRYTPITPRTSRSDQLESRLWLATAIICPSPLTRTFRAHRVSISVSKTARTLLVLHGSPFNRTITLQRVYGPETSEECTIQAHFLIFVVSKLTLPF